jgi:exodeoxyribonuclease-3
MKFVSFNTNSIRTREHQLRALIEKHHPDVIGIQETKVTDEDFPVEMIEQLGYQAEFHGQKTHYGVALLSRHPALQVVKGFPGDDGEAQRRFIQASYDIDGKTLTVMNGYFPQGESRDHPVKFPAKQKFYADLQDWIEQGFKPDQPLLVMGDMNIAPLDQDVGIGVDNAKRWLKTGKCSFLPEEREWLNRLYDWGLEDTFRCRYPDTDDRFSWFDYRSKGFEREPRRGLRIDLILATSPLLQRCRDAGIDYDIRGMEKPSDHCPIWAEFD